MFCKQCGEELITGVKHCTKCGCPVNSIETEENVGASNVPDLLDAQTIKVEKRCNQKKKLVLVAVVIFVFLISTIGVLSKTMFFTPLDLASYQGRWIAYYGDGEVAGWRGGGDIIDITPGENEDEFVLEYSHINHPPQDRIASVITTVNVNDIKSNTISIPFEEDGWGYSGIITYSFFNGNLFEEGKKMNYITVAISDVVNRNEVAAYWGVSEMEEEYFIFDLYAYDKFKYTDLELEEYEQQLFGDSTMPSIKLDTHYLSSGDDMVINITTTNFDETQSLSYEIENKDIISCSWGEWDGSSTKLFVTPLSCGETNIIIKSEDGTVSETVRVLIDQIRHITAQHYLNEMELTEEEFINSCVPLITYGSTTEVDSDTLLSYPKDYIGNHYYFDQGSSFYKISIQGKDSTVDGYPIYYAKPNNRHDVIIIDMRDDVYSPTISVGDFIQPYLIFDGVRTTSDGVDYLVFNMLAVKKES